VRRFELHPLLTDGPAEENSYLWNKSAMTAAEEKIEIVRRICEVEDPLIIKAIKVLLDASNETHDYGTELDAELKIALEESERGEGTPHEEVWAEIKQRH